MESAALNKRAYKQVFNIKESIYAELGIITPHQHKLFRPGHENVWLSAEQKGRELTDASFLILPYR